MRHPTLNKPYFEELYEVWPSWRDAINPTAIYEGYFGCTTIDIGIPFFRALIESAKGRPVFQECRTANRIEAIKKAFRGFHVFLWRNPWDQWWSYKTTDYFNAINQIIINSQGTPSPVAALKVELCLEFEKIPDDILRTLDHFRKRPLSSKNSYMIFYLLWCLGMKSGIKHADLLLNIDRLSDSIDYRNGVLASLHAVGIEQIDLSDCSIPQACYLEKDKSFFIPLEERVHELLTNSGWTKDDINQLQGIRESFKPAVWNRPKESLPSWSIMEQLTRARSIAMRMETSISEITSDYLKIISNFEQTSLQAEIKAIEAEQRSTQAESRATQAEERATQAEQRSTQAEERATQAEERATQAEERATQAEERATQAEQRANQAEQRANQAEQEKNQRMLELQIMLNSKSWRITAPIRWAALKARWFRDGTIAWLTFAPGCRPRRYANRLLISITEKILRHPILKQAAVNTLRMFPSLDFRLRSKLASSRSQHATQPVDIAELADCSIRQSQYEDQLILPLPRGRRALYIYVDHTVNCQTNTGVQRVARSMAKGLIAQGEAVRYVKWHAESKRCILINAVERNHLALWNGPEVTKEEREIYLSPDKPQTPVADLSPGEKNWLIVPEVTHITFQQAPVTLDVLMWAKRAGLMTGFVFYDAIPLFRPEMNSVVPKHMQYMQHLLLADVVWPISDWAAIDLKAFWMKHESADTYTMPEVKTMSLSGESSLCERVVEVQNGEPLILSVGTIEPRKNQVLLIQAFQEFRERHPNSPWQLILVGNLHPAVADDVLNATKQVSKISHMGHVSDKELDRLYRRCSFTVFPSVEEGFGLPILESLWYGKPCLCANFGSMAEVASGGGCLALDVRDLNALEDGLTSLIENPGKRIILSEEAVQRPIKTWKDYGQEISEHIEHEGNSVPTLGIVYFWVNSTIKFPKNTGIQRVSRQLARSMMDLGARLVPVKWDSGGQCLGSVSEQELAYLSQWNGPAITSWHSWIKPEKVGTDAWFLMPELPLDLSNEERKCLIKFLHSRHLHTAAVFYDAIPWKLRRIYPDHFTQAHRAYMAELNDYDLVLPISVFSKTDLVDFLGTELSRPQSLSRKIIAVPLPGEFAESPRPVKGPSEHEGPLRILCVGTVEPRKNHETLLEAFLKASENFNNPGLQLTIVGRSVDVEPELAKRVRAHVSAHSNIHWDENIDDARLRALHLESDFTVYPSIEEGFGLPILESLWYARPCICANFGAMREAAEGGGCLTVDVRNTEALADAIIQIATQPELRKKLIQEALSRNFKTWKEYATEVAIRIKEATPRYKPSNQFYKGKTHRAYGKTAIINSPPFIGLHQYIQPGRMALGKSAQLVSSVPNASGWRRVARL